MKKDRSATAGGPTPVDIHDGQDHVAVDRRRIRRLVRRILRDADAADRSVSVAVVDDAAMADLNRRHRRRRGTTDVLAFPLGDETDADEERLLGEVVVSGELAAREAASRGIAPGKELELYVAHGVLHLVGYDDQTPDERHKMRQAECRYVGLDAGQAD